MVSIPASITANDTLDLIEQNHVSKDYAMEHKMEHKQANC